MPKNTGRGGKNYKKGQKNVEAKRELLLKDDEEQTEYGQIIKIQGGSRMEVSCFDKKTRLGIICGQMKKREWITLGDIVLVSLRDYQDSKCDIIHKYKPEEVKTLKKMNEIPDHIKENEEQNDQGIVFGDDQNVKPQENKDVLEESEDLEIDDI